MSSARSGYAIDDSADFVIVGSGAGGATAARVLSDAGLSVLIVEEGPDLRQRERPRVLLDAMDESFRDMATVATRGSAPIPLLMGRCVGGSTAINSGIIWRVPDEVRRTWILRFGLGELLEARALERNFAKIENELGVAEVPESVLGGNAQRLRAASEALGLPGRSIHRNAPLCQGSARCLQGCPNGARQSMDVSYIPRSLQAGARLHANARARRVLFEAGRAIGVEGEVLDPETREPNGKFRVLARRGVIASGGAVFTPVLLWNSGLRRNVGEGFQAHPGVALVGRFADPVGMGYGATQSYEIRLRERGFKIESLALPPELLAARLPGAGADWQVNLSRLDHFAQFCAVHRLRARGRVRPSRLGGADVSYDPTPEDLQQIKHSVVLLARLFFAAGALEVYPGIGGLPDCIRDPAEIETVLSPAVQRHDFHLLASHHFGTAAAGGDSKLSVVSNTLQAHEAPGLYVMDASVLPTNMGVNPQHTIMGVVYGAAERLANCERPSRSAA